MPSECLIHGSFSHGAVLAEHKTIGCKQQWAYINFSGQPNNATFVGTNRDLVERLLKQPIVLQRNITKYCYIQPIFKKGGGVVLLASKDYQITTIKTSANNDIQVLTANCVWKNWCFVVTIVYKAPQTDILTFQNFLLEHLVVVGPKNNHIL